MELWPMSIENNSLFTLPGMPDVMFKEILPSLSPQEIAQVAATCRTCRNLLAPESKSFILRVRVENHMNKTITGKDLQEFKSLIGSSHRDHLPPVLQTAEKLNLRSSDLSSDNLIELFSMGPFCQAKTIDLAKCDVTDAALAIISKNCPNLETLTLENAPISDQGLAQLGANCPQLKTLSLTFCTGISADGLIQCMLQTPNLLTINLRHCSQFSEEDLKKIKEVRELEKFVTPGGELQHPRIRRLVAERF